MSLRSLCRARGAAVWKQTCLSPVPVPQGQTSPHKHQKPEGLKAGKGKSHSFPEVVSFCFTCSASVLPQTLLPAAWGASLPSCSQSASRWAQTASTARCRQTSHSSTTRPALRLSCCACHKGKTKITCTRSPGGRHAVRRAVGVRGRVAALAARWSLCLSGLYPSILAVLVSRC